MTHDELRKLCEATAKAKDFAPHGLSADVSALHRAAETHMLALLDELAKVYADRTGWPAALDRIAELEAENARLKEQLERWNAAKSSMNTTPSLTPTTGANSS